MLEIVPSNQFKKDLKLAKKRGLNLNHLRDAVNTLAQQKKLEDRYRDHNLTGVYQGLREFHIERDWFLIYRIDGNALELFLFRTGTHSDLFR